MGFSQLGKFQKASSSNMTLFRIHKRPLTAFSHLRQLTAAPTQIGAVSLIVALHVTETTSFFSLLM